jgi:hypothetical protein
MRLARTPIGTISNRAGGVLNPAGIERRNSLRVRLSPPALLDAGAPVQFTSSKHSKTYGTVSGRRVKFPRWLMPRDANGVPRLRPVAWRVWHSWQTVLSLVLALLR